MRNQRPVSVLMVATASAALQCGLVLFFVSLSFLFTLSGDSAAPLNKTVLENGMTVVIVALVVCAIFGFVSGVFTAMLCNKFVNPQRAAKFVPQEGVLLARAHSAAQ